MKRTLTAAILITLGTGLPVSAKVTATQMADAEAGCSKQGGYVVDSVTVKADGTLQVTCRESNYSRQSREANFEMKTESYEQEVSSLKPLARVYTHATGQTENDAEQLARNSAGPAPVFTAVALITLVLGATMSTSSTSSTAP